MCIMLRWYAFWILLVSILVCVGCAKEGVGLSVLHDAGIDLGVDGIVILPDASFDVVPGTPDTRPVAVDTVPVGLDTAPVVPDTKPVMPDVGPDVTPVVPDTKSVVDTTPMPDTAPAIPCDKFGPFASTGSTLSITLPTTAYCFKICPEARDPIDPLSYAWACTGFADADRVITVNGQQASCLGTAPRTSAGSVLPATVDGTWTFVLSSGGHNGDFINWAGALRVCP